MTRVPKKGIALLSAEVPGAGVLDLSGMGVRAVHKSVAGASTVVLKIKAKGKTLRKLRRTHKVKVNVTVTFTPTGGGPASATKKVKLVLRTCVDRTLGC